MAVECKNDSNLSSNLKNTLKSLGRNSCPDQPVLVKDSLATFQELLSSLVLQEDSGAHTQRVEVGSSDHVNLSLPITHRAHCSI